MRRVYHKQYQDWPDKIKRKLRRATFGREGKMRETIDNHNPMTYVMLDRGELIGWALVAEEHPFLYYHGPNFAMFYVRGKYRREGVGTRLAKRIRRDYKEVVTDAWSNCAHRFFESTGLLQLQDCW